MATQMSPAVNGNGTSPNAIFLRFPGGFEIGVSESGMRNLERLGLFLLLAMTIWLTLGDSVAATLSGIAENVAILTDKLPAILERIARALENNTT